MKVLNIGSLNIDYVYQVDCFVTAGETKSTKSLSINCGGKASTSPYPLQERDCPLGMPV